MFRRSRVWASRWLALLALAVYGVAAAERSEPTLPLATLYYGKQRFNAELALTAAQQQRGLMWRSSLPPNQGMLFVFDELSTHCMWMRNTLIPLSVAFLDSSGRIINIVDMQPLSETVNCSTAPARYALEMPQGWFRAQQRQQTEQISGIDKALADTNKRQGKR